MPENCQKKSGFGKKNLPDKNGIVIFNFCMAVLSGIIRTFVFTNTKDMRKLPLLFIVFILIGCKTTKTETEVVRIDTLYIAHYDTIKENVTQVIHDSIFHHIIETKVLNEAGEVIHSEKETTHESYRDSEKDRELIRNTIDSLLKSKQDISHEIQIVEKKEPWYKPLVQIVVGFVIAFILFLILKFKK